MRTPRSHIALRTIPLVLLLVHLGAGCEPYRRAARLDIAALGPRGVLTQAAQIAGTLQSTILSGAIQVRQEGGSLTGQASVLLAAPDTLRLDIQAFLGTTVGQAILRDTWLELYIPSDRAVYEGTVTPQILYRFTGQVLEPEAFFELLFGPALTRSADEMAASVDHFDVSPDRVIIGMPRPSGGRATYTLNDRLEYQEAVYTDVRGEVAWSANFSAYRNVGEARIPTDVTLRVPARDLELRFTASRRNARPNYGESDLRLQLPQGVRRIRLGPVPPPPPRP